MNIGVSDNNKFQKYWCGSCYTLSRDPATIAIPCEYMIGTSGLMILVHFWSNSTISLICEVPVAKSNSRRNPSSKPSRNSVTKFFESIIVLALSNSQFSINWKLSLNNSLSFDADFFDKNCPDSMHEIALFMISPIYWIFLLLISRKLNVIENGIER